MRALALAVACLLALGTSALPAPAAQLAPQQTLDLIRSTIPPVRELVSLRARMGRVAPAPSPPVEPGGPGFWINDVAARTFFWTPVERRWTSEHAEWFVELGRDEGDLPTAAEFFEQRTFPLVTRLTGARWTPGQGGAPPIAIFVGRTPGVSGYMSANDGVSRAVYPYSNERLIVYLSGRPGTTGFNGTLAHELEHLAHFTINPNQQGWLDEGLADLLAQLTTEGAVPSFATFRANSDVQLNSWAEQPSAARAHYEASQLWVRYLMDRGNGPDSLPEFIGSGGQGFSTVDHFAATRSLPGGTSQLFADWLVANWVNNAQVAGGRYGYRSWDQQVAPLASLSLDSGPVVGQVFQFAGVYYVLEDDRPVQLRAEVSPTVPLVGAADAHGSIFWSLRGDNFDSRLTRKFDLRAVGQASLHFRVWYDLEPDYDFCYALASSDSSSWQPLGGQFTTESNPTGAAYGPGYTGHSGAETPLWQQESLDLSAYAGREVWIRFECVTDQGYSAAGLAVDELEIPEIGFFDDAEEDRGWVAEGFVRAPDLMAQPALVMVVERGSDEVSVRQIQIDSAGQGQLDLPPPSPGRNRAVIVAGLAPATLEPMNYRIWLEPPAP